MRLVECPCCGAPLEVRAGHAWARCRYCGRTTQLRAGSATRPRQPVPPAPPHPRGEPPVAQSALLAPWASDPGAVAMLIVPVVVIGGILVAYGAVALAAADEEVGPPTSGSAVLDGAGGAGHFDGTVRLPWHAASTDVNEPDCRGEIPDTPHVALDGREAVELTVKASGSGGLLLVIGTAEGTIHCAEASGPGRWPPITRNVGTGRHHIYVGRTDDGPTEAPFELDVSWR